MGTLTYDGTTTHFDDRVLTHLQIVIVQKFSRKESFLMSWKDSTNVGDGRSSIWLAPVIPIHFKFSGSRVPVVNPEWLLTLGRSADSSTGLIVSDEQGKLAEGDAMGENYPGAMRALHHEQ
jgi:hypothetical protein